MGFLTWLGFSSPGESDSQAHEHVDVDGVLLRTFVS